MKKLLLGLFLFIGTSSFAQHELSGIAEGMLTVGNFAKLYQLGAGVGLKYGYEFSNHSAVTASAGIIAFKVKQNDFGFDEYAPHQLLAPLKLGYRHMIGNFWVEPQVGSTYYQVADNASQWAFTYAGGIGYREDRFDIGLRYESSAVGKKTLSFVALSVAYMFVGSR